jgi:ribosomal protein L29
VCQKVKKKEVRDKYIRELQRRVSAHKEEFASTTMEKKSEKNV